MSETKSDADILAESREYIEQHGWTRGELRDDQGVCALGGIIFSQNWRDGHDVRPEHRPDAERISTILVRTVGSEVPVPGGGVMNQLTYWNDEGDRDEQEVLDLFAKAEKIERAGYDPDA